jgi:hypothetical protein
VRKAAFLVNEIEGMKKGCSEWQSGKQSDARATIDKLIALLETEATTLADAALTPELDLVKKLRSNMN